MQNDQAAHSNSTSTCYRDKSLQVCHRLQRLMLDDQLELSLIAEWIHKDRGLENRLLRYVNSSGLGLSRPVDSVEHAVALVGAASVRAMVNKELDRLQMLHPQSKRMDRFDAAESLTSLESDERGVSKSATVQDRHRAA